ncbi:acyl-CoA thioesterase [Demequina globuliformis]|uniref:acyl-CoA thioesterase n=1 Tax=Demequina globuliformis TaxID=676202 RepID=UPI000781174B|nr:acyl-CoA thioesterase [Demequina globuliformis]
MNLWWRLSLRWWKLKRTPPASIWDTVSSEFRVYPTDLDVLGHMNNGRYLTLMDLGRYVLLKRSGWWAEAASRGWFAVVAGQTITYRRELRLGQKFTVSTRVVGFDERWCYLEQVFRVGDTIHAHALVRTRFLKRSGGSVDVEELEAALGGFPTHLRVDDWMRDWTHQTRVPSSPT